MHSPRYPQREHHSRQLLHSCLVLMKGSPAYHKQGTIPAFSPLLPEAEAAKFIPPVPG